MTTFDEREKAYEDRFALEEEHHFKARAKRNKLLGLWAAEKLGKKGEAAETYAKELIMADLEKADDKKGDEELLQKLVKDFAVAGQNYDATTVRKEMDQMMVRATEQVSGVRKV